jgi:hypothetical protein
MRDANDLLKVFLANNNKNAITKNGKSYPNFIGDEE